MGARVVTQWQSSCLACTGLQFVLGTVLKTLHMKIYSILSLWRAIKSIVQTFRLRDHRAAIGCGFYGLRIQHRWLLMPQLLT